MRWTLALFCLVVAFSNGRAFAQTTPQPGMFYCPKHGNISCRGQGDAACQSAMAAHHCDPFYHPENQCSGQSPPPVPDPPNPLRVVGPPAAFGAIGWLVGEQTVSTTTGKSMGLPGLYSGVSLGGLVTTAVVGKRSKTAAIIGGALSGAAGGQALTEYNKAQDKEPNQAMNLGGGAAAGVAIGLAVPRLVQENAQPAWLKRRLGPGAKMQLLSSARFVGVTVTW